MELARAFLVIVLAITCVESDKPPTKTTFSDFLAPLRGIFKPRQHHQTTHSGQPHIKYQIHPSVKDLSGAETAKYPGQHQASGNEGFRPYFPSEFENSPSSLGGESSSSRPYTYNTLPEHYSRIRAAPSNRVPRQESNQGFVNDFQPFENIDAQQDGGPSGFSDFGFGTPDFSQSFEQPQQHGQPRPSRRPIVGEHGPQESQGFAPGPAPYTRGSSGQPRRRPFRGPRPNPETETQFSGPQHRQYHPSPSASYPSSSNNFPERYPQRHVSGEPQITTNDYQQENVIHGSVPYFDEIYRQPSTQSGPAISYTRPIPTFTSIPSGEGNRSPNYDNFPSQNRPSYNVYAAGAASDEMYQETKPRKQFALRPRRPSTKHVADKPVQSTSRPEIHYGRPVMMMSASTPTATATAVKKIPRPYHKKFTGKPVLLTSPKIPNYMKSSSISTPSIVPYEPQAAASGHGVGSGGDFGGIQSNGDRILYHVAGHEGPYSYRFGYDTGRGYVPVPGYNRLFRFEEKDKHGFVKGKYGYYDKHGKMNVVNYEAHPQNGFRAERGH